MDSFLIFFLANVGGIYLEMDKRVSHIGKFFLANVGGVYLEMDKRVSHIGKWQTRWIVFLLATRLLRNEQKSVPYWQVAKWVDSEHRYLSKDLAPAQ